MAFFQLLVFARKIAWHVVRKEVRGVTVSAMMGSWNNSQEGIHHPHPVRFEITRVAGRQGKVMH